MHLEAVMASSDGQVVQYSLFASSSLMNLSLICLVKSQQRWSKRSWSKALT